MTNFIRGAVQKLLGLAGLRLLYQRNCPQGTAASNYREIQRLALNQDASRCAILDIGANFGTVTSELLSLFPVTVHAFEPSPHVFQSLQQRFEGNSRVICHPMAV